MARADELGEFGRFGECGGVPPRPPVLAMLAVLACAREEGPGGGRAAASFQPKHLKCFLCSKAHSRACPGRAQLPPGAAPLFNFCARRFCAEPHG